MMFDILLSPRHLQYLAHRTPDVSTINKKKATLLSFSFFAVLALSRTVRFSFATNSFVVTLAFSFSIRFFSIHRLVNESITLYNNKETKALLAVTSTGTRIAFPFIGIFHIETR